MLLPCHIMLPEVVVIAAIKLDNQHLLTGTPSPRSRALLECPTYLLPQAFLAQASMAS